MTASSLFSTIALVAGQATDPAPDNESLWVQAEQVIVRPGVELENAAILVERGRIIAVGSDVPRPPNARELRGKVACAGFVDPWSSLGLDPGSLNDLGTTAATRTVDGLDPWLIPEERDEALRGGVTTVRVQVGGSAQVGGLGAVIRTDPAPSLEVILDDACLAATVAITRGGRELDVFDRVEEVDRLVGQIERGKRYREEAIEYRYDLEEWEKAIEEKKKELEEDFKKAKKDREKELEEAEEKGKEFKEERYKEDKKPKRPKYDPDAETFARAADGELPLVVEVHRLPELRGLLEKTGSIDRLRLIVAGATEALELAEELAERSIPIILWPAPLGSGARGEWRWHDLELAGELDRAGIEVLIGSGGGPHARDLRLLAALAVGHGLDRESALHAITTGPAEAFDVGERVGSLERGKAADILLFDGDPLDTNSELLHVVSEGRVIE